jgi:hypothetical protein
MVLFLLYWLSHQWNVILRKFASFTAVFWLPWANYCFLLVAVGKLLLYFGCRGQIIALFCKTMFEAKLTFTEDRINVFVDLCW